jgi:hypothetical protein
MILDGVTLGKRSHEGFKCLAKLRIFLHAPALSDSGQEIRELEDSP